MKEIQYTAAKIASCVFLMVEFVDFGGLIFRLLKLVYNCQPNILQLFDDCTDLTDNFGFNQ